METIKELLTVKFFAGTVVAAIIGVLINWFLTSLRKSLSKRWIAIKKYVVIMDVIFIIATRIVFLVIAVWVMAFAGPLDEVITRILFLEFLVLIFVSRMALLSLKDDIELLKEVIEESKVKNNADNKTE